MPTEVIEIVIREKGARATSSGITRVGRASRTAAAGVGLLVAGLAALAAGRGFAGIARDAIQASAAFEGYRVRLGALLGNQGEANKALETFVDVASKTPFAVGQVVAGAATLAGAALGNRERLEELTVTAANLAAVTGLSFQESAGNLQRSLQAGIGAADLFRERGVRAVIEAIGGIPDATKLSTDELEALFQEAFGEGGVFGDAAENLSKTLGGALSNVGDAAQNLRVELGDALAPGVIDAARNVIIPFLKDLQQLVEDNSEEITAFANDSLNVAIRFFGLLTEAAVGTIRVLNRLRGLGNVFQGIIGENQIEETTRSIAVLESNLAAAQARGDQPLIDTLEGRLENRRGDLIRLRATVDDLANSNREAGIQAAEFDKTLDSIAARGRQLSTGDFNLSTTAPEIDAGVNLPDVERAAQESQARIDARAEILSLTERITLADAKRLEPLDAQLIKLERQRDALLEAAEAAEDRTLAEEGLRSVSEQIAAVEAEKAFELDRQATLQNEITGLIAQAALISPELAAEIKAAADEAVRAGGGLEAVNNALEKTKEGAKRGLEGAKEEADKFSADFGRTLSSTLGSAVSGAIKGEGFDAVSLMADLAGKLLEDALNSALEGGFGDLGGIFGSAGGEGGIGGGGGGFGAAAQAGIGAGLSVLSGALKETSTSISNDLIRSAASQSSAAATRGVIAGPTNIPIFQVGQQLEAAFGPTNDILEEMLAALLSIASAGNLATGAAGGSGLDFDSTTPSLT